MYRGVYIGRLDNTSVSAARSLIQLNVASTCAAVVFDLYLDYSSTTSTSLRVRLRKVTTAGTGTSFTPIKIWGHPTALSTFTNNHTAEGTSGDTIWDRFFNYVPGMERIEIPETRVTLAPSERLALDFPGAPGAAVTLSAGMKWGEIG